MTHSLCDQCDANVIQGLLCHERGCPNKPDGMTPGLEQRLNQIEEWWVARGRVKPHGYNDTYLGQERAFADITFLLAALREASNERDNLLAMTRLLDEHPEGWDGPCECKLCMSYAD